MELGVRADHVHVARGDLVHQREGRERSEHLRVAEARILEVLLHHPARGHDQLQRAEVHLAQGVVVRARIVEAVGPVVDAQVQGDEGLVLHHAQVRVHAQEVRQGARRAADDHVRDHLAVAAQLGVRVAVAFPALRGGDPEGVEEVLVPEHVLGLDQDRGGRGHEVAHLGREAADAVDQVLRVDLDRGRRHRVVRDHHVVGGEIAHVDARLRAHATDQLDHVGAVVGVGVATDHLDLRGQNGAVRVHDGQLIELGGRLVGLGGHRQGGAQDELVQVGRLDRDASHGGALRERLLTASAAAVATRAATAARAAVGLRLALGRTSVLLAHGAFLFVLTATGGSEDQPQTKNPGAGSPSQHSKRTVPGRSRVRVAHASLFLPQGATGWPREVCSWKHIGRGRSRS